MRTTIIRFFLNIWLRLPFGHICRIHHDKAHITLLKNYWVVVSDGASSDALPITVISPALQHELALRMKAIGYDVDAYFDNHTATAAQAKEDTTVVNHKPVTDAAIVAAMVETTRTSFMDY